MENASKALLIAGGILTALLIISALVLMFNQIGAYGKSQEEMKRNSQLAEFNKEFEKYLDDKGITGADVISLINKVVDYNIKARNGGVIDSVDYSVKLKVKISNLDAFNTKYAYENSDFAIFKATEYTIGENYAADKLVNQLKKDFDNASNLENIGIPKDQLKILSGMYDASKGKKENINNIHKKLIEIDKDKYQNWDGSTNPTLDTIKKYRQYWEFKTSKFLPDGDPIYATNGQITQISVKFDK